MESPLLIGRDHRPELAVVRGVRAVPATSANIDTARAVAYAVAGAPEGAEASCVALVLEAYRQTVQPQGDRVSLENFPKFA